MSVGSVGRGSMACGVVLEIVGSSEILIVVFNIVMYGEMVTMV